MTSTVLHVLAWAVVCCAAFLVASAFRRDWRGTLLNAVLYLIVYIIIASSVTLLTGGCDAHAATRYVRHADGRVTLMIATAAPITTLRFTLPAFQQGQPCADGAPLAWIDSARVVACKRGPSGPYSSAAWRAYLAQPDTVLAQHAVSWTRIGQPDSFTVAALDTGATLWVQVRGTRGWSGVCAYRRAW